MNVELLRQVQKDILTEPEHFHMRYFCGQGWDCNTTFCIAGWAILRGSSRFSGLDASTIAASKRVEEIDFFAASETASLLLGLLEEQEEELFYSENWDQPFRDKYDSALKNENPEKAAKESAKVAANYIDYFINKYSNAQPT